MPHFENLESFETNSRSGKKKITPMAPHSSAGYDYRPVKRDQNYYALPRNHLKIKDIDVEPIDVAKMEKEFRQADRKVKNRRGSAFGRWRKWLVRKLRDWGLLPSKQKKKSRGKPRRGRGGQGKKGNQPNNQPQGNQRPQEGKRGNRPKKRNRNRQGNPPGNAGKQPKGQQQEGASKEGGKQRSRRPRKPNSQGQGSRKNNQPRNRGRPSSDNS